MSLDVQMHPEVRAEAAAKALPTLLAVNAVLSLPIEQMLTRIEQELGANPALERDPVPCAQCGHPMEGVICARCGYSVLGGTARLRGERPRVAEVIDDDADRFRTIAQPVSLHDHLEGALAAHVATARDRRIGRYLIGSLDRRGYLDADLDFIAAELGVDVDEVARVLSILQTLEPPGVGARSVQECLLIQLRQLPASPARDLAARVVRDHLDEVAREEHARIARTLGVSVGAVRDAVAFIRRYLCPAPADRFLAEHGGDRLRPEETALPDVILHRAADGYRIEINGTDAQRLRVNPAFKQFMVESRLGAAGAADSDREAVRRQMARARLFIETVRRRNWTLYSIVERIVEVQRGYLDHGPAHLQPLTMSAVARALRISESTVSRALDGKFVQLPSGRVVSFTVFFDQSTPVKERIKALIVHENPRRPLTDGALAVTLAADGVAIARRTVAKYREELKIPTSASRRHRDARDHAHTA